MKLKNSTKIAMLFVGDVVALYAALFLALVVRYGAGFAVEFTGRHVVPFSFIFPIWIAIFYSAGLYDLRRLRNNLDFLKTLSLTLFVNALLTVALFYLIPAFGITPKTNLVLFIAAFALIESWWRRTWNIRASFRDGLSNVLLLDRSPRAAELAELLRRNPQFGYVVRSWPGNPHETLAKKNAFRTVRASGINVVVVPAHLKNDAVASETLYELLSSGIEIRDLPAFYETVLRKVPLEDIERSWFIEHAIGERKFYDDLKRGLEFCFAVLLGVVLLPLELLIAALVALTSPGPFIYAQQRVGKDGRVFTLYKFRTMRENAEARGPRWAERSDPRTTPVGHILRRTHLDELPQLWNIIMGDLSFVGPRPERPEIIAKIEDAVPYYDIRHLVKPGVTGWAQINYRADETTKDVMEKVAYDLYYIKNRSLIIDLAIIVKTLKTLFVTPQ